jgi:hypothetical protein
MIFFNKFWRIAKRIQTEQLHQTEISDIDFSEKDLFQLNIGKRGSTLFLGYYSKEGINLAFHKYGIYKELAKKGFEDIVTDIDTSDPYKHKISLYHKIKNKDNLIIELVVRKIYFSQNMPWKCQVNGRSYEGLAIDWLLIQNILGTFNQRRPRLPGQKYPGLGFSPIVLELLLIICWRLNLVGLINVPDHYHNAYLYSRAFYYLDPDDQAIFLALKNKFDKYSLDKISWGIDWGCVIDLNCNQPFQWIAKKQIIPLEKELKSTFHSKRYREYIRDKEGTYNFAFDEKKYLECKSKVTDKNMEKCI